MNDTKNYSFFQNRKCEYFPCHKGLADDEFNCLFCYCPLYALGKKCGGAFVYNEKGYKVCTGCTVPHRRENYDMIVGRYKEIMDVVRKNDED